MDEQHDEALPHLKLSDETLSPPDAPDGFDINYYLDMASGFDMSEEEKIELLTILWDIMKRFVELGWGVDSVTLLDDENTKNFS